MHGNHSVKPWAAAVVTFTTLWHPFDTNQLYEQQTKILHSSHAGPHGYRQSFCKSWFKKQVQRGGIGNYAANGAVHARFGEGTIIAKDTVLAIRNNLNYFFDCGRTASLDL